MPKSDQNFMRLLVFGVSAELNCLLNDLTEIFFAIFLFFDVFYAFPTYNICAVNSIKRAACFSESELSVQLKLEILSCSGITRGCL